MKEKELTLEYVRLANFDDETTEIFQEEFKQHFSLNEEKPSKEAEEQTAEKVSKVREEE